MAGSSRPRSGLLRGMTCAPVCGWRRPRVSLAERTAIATSARMPPATAQIAKRAMGQPAAAPSK